MVAGYSGTPLIRKLGFKAGHRVWFAGLPDNVHAEIDPDSHGIVMLAAPEPALQAAHVFVTDRSELQQHIDQLRNILAPDGMIWVSWPKKAAKVVTDVTEDVVRAIALPTGLVDVKVCAIDEKWSGLKLVIRKALRTS